MCREPCETDMSLKDLNAANPRKLKRVALVLANPAKSTPTGWPVGFWWSELSHPYFLLTEKAYDVELFSPKSGSSAFSAACPTSNRAAWWRCAECCRRSEPNSSRRSLVGGMAPSEQSGFRRT